MIQAPSSAFIIGGIRYYSLFMGLAIFAGSFVSCIFSKKYFKNYTDYEILLDMLPVIIISGIIGARLYYVLVNLSYFMRNLDEIIKIQNGGISIHGAILGGLIGGIIFCKIKKIKILPYADVISFGLILAQAIGRLGNYFNQEAFGKPYDGLLKLYVDEAQRPLLYRDFSYFHPAFLYEIIWNLIVFALLFVLLKTGKKYKEGVIFFSYAILYSIGRFLIEGIRTDSAFNIGQVPIAQIVSVLIIILSSVCLFIIYKGDAS